MMDCARWGGIAAKTALISSLLTAPALAQSDSGSRLGDAIANAFVASINQSRMNRAAHSWEAVETDVQTCMAEQEKLPVPSLIQNYIGADDRRIAPQLAECRQIAENQRAAAATAERAAADEAVLAEQQRQADAQAQVRRAALAAQQVDARRGDLTSRYGSAVANAILAGQVTIGMTSDQVIASIGEPARREQLTPSDAIWHYGARRISFSNGHVAAIRN